MIREINALRPFWEAQRLKEVETRVRDLWRKTFSNELRRCNCPDLLNDAFITLFRYYKNMDTKGKARLVGGCYFFTEGGEFVTNDNITDAKARAFLKRYPSGKSKFDILPDMNESEEESPTEAVTRLSAENLEQAKKIEELNAEVVELREVAKEAGETISELNAEIDNLQRSLEAEREKVEALTLQLEAESLTEGADAENAAGEQPEAETTTTTRRGRKKRTEEAATEGENAENAAGEQPEAETDETK